MMNNMMYGWGGPQRMQLQGSQSPAMPNYGVRGQIAQAMGAPQAQPAQPQFQAQPNRMMQIPRTPGAGTSY